MDAQNVPTKARDDATSHHAMFRGAREAISCDLLKKALRASWYLFW